MAVHPGTDTDGVDGLQVISGGPYAVCGFKLDPDDFTHAWEEAFAWLVSSGYPCDDKPCFEMYHNNAAVYPEGKWNVDICIPLKRER